MTFREKLAWFSGALVSWGLFWGLILYTYATSGGAW